MLIAALNLAQLLGGLGIVVGLAYFALGGWNW